MSQLLNRLEGPQITQEMPVSIKRNEKLLVKISLCYTSMLMYCHFPGLGNLIGRKALTGLQPMVLS